MSAAILGSSAALVASPINGATIYGGPTYDSATGNGYNSPIFPIGRPGLSAGNGLGVATVARDINGTGVGSRVVRWNPTGWTELGTIGTNSNGEAGCLAYATNASGSAVGWGWKYSGGLDLGQRAVRWDATGTTATELGNLGTYFGSTYSEAYAINDSGTAVGYAVKYNGSSNLGDRAVRWNAGSTTATELGNIGVSRDGFTDCYAYAIGPTGTIAGSAYKFVNGSLIGENAVRWDAGGTAATELGPLGTNSNGDVFTRAYAVNASGTVVGHGSKFVGGNSVGFRAIRWDAGSAAATELGVLGTDSSGRSESMAYAINTAGSAVGYALKNGSSSLGKRAVRWDAGGTAAVELGNLGTTNIGSTECQAFAINSSGMAAGWASAYAGNGSYVGHRAVVWGADGAAINLNSLLSPADAASWTLFEANGISDTNWVTGIGTYDPDGAGPLFYYSRLFIMQVPEPSSFACSISLLLPRLWRRRRV